MSFDKGIIDNERKNKMIKVKTFCDTILDQKVKNRYINAVNRLYSDHKNGYLKKWLKFSQIVERLSHNRMQELEYGAFYKQKNTALVKKTHRLKKIIKKYKDGKLTQKEYVTHIKFLKDDYKY